MESVSVSECDINILNINDVEILNKGLEDKFPKSELREVEQYFFSESVVQNLVDALEYEDDIICLGTPAVAHGFYLKGRNISCLDIDRRFDYLPGYIYFDILNPCEIKIKPKVLIIDPPFFKMNLNDLFKCVELLTKEDKTTKIIFAFVQREEKSLLNIFKPYNLKLTKFKMEYRFVESGKWTNYGLYSNCEFNKIKFVNKEKSAKKNNVLNEKLIKTIKKK